MNKFFPWVRNCRYALLLAIVAAATLLMSGCGGSDSYTEPTATITSPIAGQTQNVLIDVATLKSWIDAGLVNNDQGFEKIVILDYTSQANYDAGHIRGAQLWDSGGIERYEGPVLSGNMVLDGPTMDALLQERGIDSRTTVVFAGNGNPSRLYFMFRYWGFPKERLKVLNGWTTTKAVWDAAGIEWTTVAPMVQPSSFSVKDLPAMRPDLRAALNEFIIAVEEQTALPLNALTNNTERMRSTTGIFAPSAFDIASGFNFPYTLYASPTATGGCPSGTSAACSNDYTIFQGTIDGAVHVGNAGFYETVDGVQRIKSVADLNSFLAPFGVDGSLPIITYCRAGNAAANAFMPIDAALGWNAMVYDGSWSQWGSLTNNTDAASVPDVSFALPAVLSEWATDVITTDGYREVSDGPILPGIYYNVNFPTFIEKPTFRILEGMLSPYDSKANSIEIEDFEYWSAPKAGSAPGPVSGGGGGGC